MSGVLITHHSLLITFDGMSYARHHRRVVRHRQSGRALAVVADVSRYDEVAHIIDAATEKFGGSDVWMNNASVAEWSFIESMEPDEMRRVVEVVLLGVMHGCRAVVPHLRARGGGTIINVASALADRAVPLLSTYCASKAGVKSFSDALRMELRATNANINVVVILPSSIDTPFYSWGRSRLGVRPHFYMLQRNEMFRAQYSSRPDRGESNLFASTGETRVRGDFTEEAHETATTRLWMPAAALALLGWSIYCLARRRGSA